MLAAAGGQRAGSADDNGNGIMAAQRWPREMLQLRLLAAAAMLAMPLPVGALDNGLALTPQLGWSSWNHFGPGISANLTLGIADALLTSGMAAAGFSYVNLDDAWMDMERLPNRSLTWDPVKFPEGMPALAAAMHRRNLSLGLYSARCRRTCCDYPASFGHEVRDAASLSHWNVDYLKFDNCRDCPATTAPIVQFAQMATALNATGRRIFYSNELIPDEAAGLYETAWTFSNSARVGGDINPSWGAIVRMIDIDEPLAPWAGPGFWNDCDMLEVGNGMSEVEDRSHFALWCILAAPLIAGNDLRSMSAATTAILTNPGAIGVNQDPLGSQAIVCHAGNNTQVWAKPMSDGSTVVLLLNRDDHAARDIQVPFASCIMHGTISKISAHDVWNGTSLGSFTSGSFTARGVAPHASVFVKLTPALVSGHGVRHCAETSRPCSVITAGRKHHLCAKLDQSLPPLTLHCPVGTVIAAPTAMFGALVGSCSNGYQPHESCDADSAAVSGALAAHCGGRSRCRIESAEFLELFERPTGSACETLLPLRNSSHGCQVISKAREGQPYLRFASTYRCVSAAVAIKSDDSQEEEGRAAMLHWVQGDAQLAQLAVAMDTTAGTTNYSITVDGRVWLKSVAGAVARPLFCDGAWMQPSGHDVSWDRAGHDAMGNYTSLIVGHTDAATKQQILTQEFRYYPEAGSIRFLINFSRECANSRLPVNPVHDEYNASSLPLSRFPEFRATNATLLGSELGWLTWQSRFSMDGTAHGLHGILNNGSDVKRPSGTTQHYPRDNSPEAWPSNRFYGGATGGPLVLFDAAAPSSHALVLSPADNFLDTILGFEDQTKPSSATLSGGIQGKVESVPAGTVVSFLLTPTRSGVNSAMEAWGRDLRNLHNTTRNKADIVVSKLGYWTDNGGFYDCDGTSATKNRPNQATLTALATQMKQDKIPIRYMQLDPFWYEQSAPPARNKNGQVGCSDAVAFRASRELFPTGITGLHNATGLPLLLYTAMWSANRTPAAYPDYSFIKSTSFKDGFAQQVKANVAPADSHRWYSAIFQNMSGGGPPIGPTCSFETGVDYSGGSGSATISSFLGATPATCCAACQKNPLCKVWTTTTPGADGRCWLKTAAALSKRIHTVDRISMRSAVGGGSPMVGFEVDFLDSNLLTFSEFSSTFGAAAAWMGGWGKAGEDFGLSAQICMDLPSAALNSLLLPAISNARASEDNFPGGNAAASPGWQQGRWKIAYTSLFYDALDLAPFFDVVWTSAVEPGNPYKGASRNNVELQFMLSSLGNGPLGIGDGIGQSNRSRIMQAVEADGSLRKALKPLTPIDAMFGDSSLGVPIGAEIFNTVSSFAIDTGAATDPHLTDWLWWHIVGVNLTSTPFRIGPDDLTPSLQPHIAYVAYKSHSNTGDSLACVDGAAASGCGVTLFGHGHPPLELSTPMPHGRDELGFGLWRVAPLCEGFSIPTRPDQQVSGYALLGETNKYLAVTPQRFVRLQCSGGEGTFFIQYQGGAFEAMSILLLDATSGMSNATLVEIKHSLDQHGRGAIRCDDDGCAVERG